MSTTMQAQVNCPLDTLMVSDTIEILSPLGKCEITAADIFAELGIDTCQNASVFPAGPFTIDDALQEVLIFDDLTNARVADFVLNVNPMPLLGYTSMGAASVITMDYISFPLAAGETAATKDMILDQMGVVDDEIIRSNIHFYQGASRLVNFPIGDTVFIDRIECNGLDYYDDVSVQFIPQVSTFSGTMDFDINLSTCKIQIEDILLRLGYDPAVTGVDRFEISDLGPFGYGDHLLTSIKLDDYLLLDRAVISVTSSNGPRTSILFGDLGDGKCFLNESDVINELGINQEGRDCNLQLVEFDPPGPYQNTVTTINSISIDGVVVWSTAFDVAYSRDTIFNEQGNLFCNDNLNISMGPNCSVTIDAEDMLESGGYCYLNYNIEAAYQSDPFNVVYEGNSIEIVEPGQYSVTITNPFTGNSCWSYIEVEDKYMPNIVCVPDTVLCYEPNHLIPDTLEGRGPDFPMLDMPATFELVFTGSYLVNTEDLCGISEARYSDMIRAECEGEFKQIIDRFWTFEDRSGNVDTCLQTIYVQAASVDDIDRFEQYVEDCIDDFMQLDDNGWPHPDETGYPTIDGQYPADICGNLKMQYNDTPFPLCGNSVKLVRRWTILDWCSDEVDQVDQIILIEDKEAPVFNLDDEDLDLESDPFVCGQITIRLPEPVYEDCDEDISLEVFYQSSVDGTLEYFSNGSSLIIPEIQMMDTATTFSVVYVLTDACGNAANDTLEISIRDNEPPVAVCDQFTTLSIGGNGEAQLRAFTFDDLSVDNCGIASYSARKKSGECYLEEEFSERIRFCCEEVGDTIQIEFMVTDWAGNSNTCWVSVFVQDKFRPQITCPDTAFIDCGQDYKDFELTGMPTFRDNCNGTEIITVDEAFINACGTGYVRRQWVIIDRGEFEETCEQIIIIEEKEPFSVTDIDFPEDIDLDGCNGSLDPEELGEPVLNIDGCANVDASHEDLPFYDVEDACLKILREWTVVDWCQLSDDDASAGFWRDVQIIKVLSEEGPIIEFPEVQEFCTESADCNVNVQITVSGVDGDGCTPPEDIIWNYGLWDADSNTPVQSGSSPALEAELSAGNYMVIYAAQDGCQNITVDTLDFQVLDCLAPEIVCPPIQPTLVLNEDGIASLNVSELDVQLTDNCDDASDISISFAADSLVEIIEFDCDDIFDGVEELGFLTVYATDLSGNKDSCELFLLISDNSADICPDVIEEVDTAMVAGLITTDNLIELDSVFVTLESDSDKFTVMTGTNGQFQFEDLVTGVNYNLSLERNINLDEGISTIDILLIQRHLLGISAIESPYKIIAADVDNNSRVSSADMLNLRRLLLGKISEFPRDQKSWRFVEADQTWEDNFDPFPFTERIPIEPLTENFMGADFMAIKIGDVNGDNPYADKGKSKSRSTATYLEARLTKQSIEFYSTVDEDLSGLQLALSGVHNSTITYGHKGMIDLEDKHMQYDEDSKELLVSWTAPEGLYVEKGDLLFSLDRHRSNIGLDQIGISNRISSEWISMDLDNTQLALKYEKLDSGLENSLSVSIAPNPWQEQTQLNLYLPQDDEVVIQVLNLNGQQLYQKQMKLPQGAHTSVITQEDLPNISGLVIVKISSSTDQILQRMTILK